MRLTPQNRDRFRILFIALIILTVLVSGSAAAYLGRETARQLRSELSERSKTIAAALKYSDVAQLKGRESDADTTIYKELKSQLAAVKTANPGSRSIYLMGRHDNRQLFFYVDSEQPDSEDYSSAAEAYNDGTDADTAMFDTGQTVVEGPVTDDYGTFISGLAPIKNPATDKVMAVIGIDVASSTYWRDIILTALVPIMTGVSFILIMFVFENIRRRNLQLLALRSELVSVASHELRNPITGMRWAADSLEKMNKDEKLVRMIRAIKHSAEGLQASTDDILELSHAMNRRSLNIAEVDMSKLMQEIFDVQALSAQQKSVTLLYDAGWPPALIVHCDADQMKRVLHNVVSNAIKYTGQGTTVTVGYRQDDTYHHLWVKDQGIGIPADEQAKVFKGFYRASNAVASRVPGTGLGLYLVKAVLKQHDGLVSFTSVQDKGTIFVLSLPKR